MTIAPAVRTDGVLRPRDGGGTTAFLPTTTVQSHAANLAWLPRGDLACVWFGGTQEGVADINIYLSTLPSGGQTWGEPVRLSNDPSRSEQNPVLFTATPQQVWLLYTAQLAGHQDTSEVRRRVSRDGGYTWAEPTVLFPATARGGVFVRQPPIRLATGRILVPVFNCLSVPGGDWVGDADTSSVWYSDDDGSTWTEAPVPASTGCVHMNILPRQDGTLWACFRSRWADHIWEATSADDGITWTQPVPTALPNNNSSIQVAAFGDRRAALVFNDSSAADATARRVSLYDEIDDDGIKADPSRPEWPTEGRDTTAGDASSEGGPRTAFWGAPRAPMSLALSLDEGRHWSTLLELETGDGYCLTNNSRDGRNRELSYPTALPGADGDLHIAYTWHRRAIRYVHLPAKTVAHLAAKVSPKPEAG